MSSERRGLISELYHAALPLTAEEREAFLTKACGADTALREEVESLLRFEAVSEGFLETPVAIAGPAGSSMVMRQIGPYTIVAPLGAGGMGAVYRARDSKLGRDVAIKILPSHFTADPERRARFAREARLLATLNHPHIGAIYGLEETDGVSALVLELVEGPTLAERLDRGALPIPQALAIARQIAEALEAAHDKGIVHRDLKPANIVLQGTLDGLSTHVRAKVLDFGLAKPMALEGAAAPTEGRSGSFDGTVDGRILGTPAYMSPEQARGLTVDKRTDIWAFGCVVYEMLTGRPPFEGATTSDTVVSILERSPDWMALPAATPAAVRRLLERCLRKDLRQRLHDIADAILDIEDAGGPPPGTSGADVRAPAGRNRSFRAGMPWLVAAALAFALAWVGWLYYHAARALPTEPAQLAIHPPEGVELPTVPHFVLSPDGRHLAFTPQMSNRPMLWVHSLVTGQAVALRSTEDASGPFWKPDSQEIAYFAGNQLKTVALSGGSPVAVTEVPTRGAGTWNRAGTMVVSQTTQALYKISAPGGTLEPATVLAEGDITHRAPVFLPDGEHFLYLAQVASSPQLELRVGSLRSKEIAESLGPFESTVAYAGGYLFFVRGGHIGGGNLTAWAFDPERRRLIGAPIALGLPVPTNPPWQYGGMSVSGESDRLVYQPRGRALMDLAWRNRAGETIGIVGEPGPYLNVDISPDDQRVAVSRQTQEAGKPMALDIWTIDVQPGGVFRRVTDDPAFEHDPAWSADGQYVAFISNRADRHRQKYGLYVRLSTGAGTDQAIAEPVRLINSPDWSFDNRHIVYMDDGDLWTVSIAADHKPSKFLATPATERQPVFSPDGRWIAYCSDSSGRDEVYIRAFPSGDTAHPISRAGGWAPRWGRDGRELFFLSLESTMMAVSVDPTGRTGVPRELFRTALRRDQNRPYDVSSDGQRFLVPTLRPSDDYRVVLNWRALLPR